MEDVKLQEETLPSVSSLWVGRKKNKKALHYKISFNPCPAKPGYTLPLQTV